MLQYVGMKQPKTAGVNVCVHHMRNAKQGRVHGNKTTAAALDNNL